MTTKEISQQIVSSLIGEIPIEYRDGRDQKEIEEEMNAIVADGIERAKKQTVEKACQYLRDHIDPGLTIYHNGTWCSLDNFITKFREAMLNKNKE